MFQPLTIGYPQITLNDKIIKNAKPKEKPYKLSDGGGLYLLVSKSGSKLWRLKYRISQKEKTLSCGAYPTVSLKEAREKKEDAKRLLDQGIDPSQHKQDQKRQKVVSEMPLFLDCEIIKG